MYAKEEKALFSNEDQSKSVKSIKVDIGYCPYPYLINLFVRKVTYQWYNGKCETEKSTNFCQGNIANNMHNRILLSQKENKDFEV